MRLLKFEPEQEEMRPPFLPVIYIGCTPSFVKGIIKEPSFYSFLLLQLIFLRQTTDLKLNQFINWLHDIKIIIDDQDLLHHLTNDD